MPVRDVDKAKFVARMPVLAKDRVNFVGQPVAAVVVDNKYDGPDALEEISVDYEPLTPVTTIEDSLKGDVVIHEGATDNISIDIYVGGGELSAFSEADVVLKRRIYQPRVVSNPLEPKGCVAYYDGDVLNMVVSAQSVFRIRADISEALGFPPEKIRVVAPKNVGGGFGNKVPAYPEYVVAAYASMKLRRPVKWIETRREHLVNPTQGRGILSEVEIYAKKNGRILGFRGRVVVDLGAYNFTINTRAPTFIATLIPGPYKVKALDIRAVGVYTNLPPTGPYRGAGRPEAALIHETLVEDLAEELGMDPVELRRINLAEEGYVTPGGWSLGRHGGSEVLEIAEKVYRAAKERFRNAGVGLALFVEHIRITPGEGCRLRIENCRVKIGLGGIGPHGQAHRSAFKKIVSRYLGVAEEDVDVYLSSTDWAKWGAGSFGSRSTAIGAAAIFKAVEELKKAAGERGLIIPRDLCKLEGFEVNVEVRGEDVFGAGAHVAVVDFDEEHMRPVILYYFAADNVGNLVIKEEVEAQLEGGAAQAAAQIFFEEASFDEDGNPKYMSIIQSGFPTATDLVIKNFEVEEVLKPSTLPGGFIGVGESGTTGGLAAIFIAVEKMLRSKFGIVKKIEKLPISIAQYIR
jgi:carbon-monoxide dehydrogenase large subunit